MAAQAAALVTNEMLNLLPQSQRLQIQAAVDNYRQVLQEEGHNTSAIQAYVWVYYNKCVRHLFHNPQRDKQASVDLPTHDSIPDVAKRPPTKGDISLTVTMLSGQAKQITGLRLDQRLASLQHRAAEEFDVPISQIRLLMDGQLLAPEWQFVTLEKLHIRSGSSLSCVRIDPAQSSQSSAEATRNTFPPSLQKWLQRLFDNQTALGANADLQKLTHAYLRSKIQEWVKTGELWEVDWHTAPIPTAREVHENLPPGCLAHRDLAKKAYMEKVDELKGRLMQVRKLKPMQHTINGHDENHACANELGRARSRSPARSVV